MWQLKQTKWTNMEHISILKALLKYLCSQQWDVHIWTTFKDTASVHSCHHFVRSVTPTKKHTLLYKLLFYITASFPVCVWFQWICQLHARLLFLSVLDVDGNFKP